MDNLRELLCREVKRRNWKAVVASYAKHAEAQRLRLTPSGDTALHLAVFHHQLEVVTELVRLIVDDKVLRFRDNGGNTPLHAAASAGSAAMCHCIAWGNLSVVDERNNDGEMPLFLAALLANKEAFYYLYNFCDPDVTRIASNCRRTMDGDTVLHCALRNGQIDLALAIINMNNESIGWVDGQGFTPLHVLASNPTLFQSGSLLSGWRKMVYYFISVEKLKPESEETITRLWEQERFKAWRNSNFPDNYATCIQFFAYLWGGIIFLIVKERAKKKFEGEEEKDLEAPHDRISARAGPSMKPWSRSFPETYSTCFDFFNTIYKAIITVILWLFGIIKIREEKEKHSWSVQVMEEVLRLGSSYNYFDDGNIPFWLTGPPGYTLPHRLEQGVVWFGHEAMYGQERQKTEFKYVPTDSAISKAVKNGVSEIVRGVYQRYQDEVIRDISPDGKKQNLLHLAARYRQPEVLTFLLDKKSNLRTIFIEAIDDDGNNALHLAARAPPSAGLGFWRITGTAFQINCEVNWYQFVKKSVPDRLCGRMNGEGQTPDQMFVDTHKGMVDEGEKWLNSCSQSCSVVAALIATVAFASAASVPGGNGDSGYAVLEKKQVFFIYALSSLIALSLSSASVIMFLAILTSRLESYYDFGKNLPWKLLIALSSLYFSIIAMLTAFSAAHFFLLSHRLHDITVFVYTLVFLPVAIILATSHFPLYFDLLRVIISKVPKRRTDVVLLSD